MDNRSRRSRNSLSWAPSAIAVAALSLWTGYAHNPASNCDAFIRKAQGFREAGNPAATIRWTGLGERQCRAEGLKQSWRLRILKAESLKDSGAYPAALETLAPEPPASPEFANLRSRRLGDQAWIAFFLARYDSAAHLWDASETAAREAQPVDPDTLAQVFLARLYLYGQIGDLEAARRAMDWLERAGPVADRPHLLGTYGWVLDRSGRFEEAAQYYEAALTDRALRTSPLEAGKFYNNLAGIYYHLGDLDQALGAALQAEPALRNGSNLSGLRVCLNTIGLIYSDRGELTKAQDYLERARAIAVQLNEQSSIAEVDNNLATVAIEGRAWEKAAAWNAGAFAIEKEQRDTESQQYSIIASARILAGQKDFRAALTALEALTAQRFRNPNPRIDAEVESIAIYRQLRNEAKAREHYRAARALITNVESSMRKDENKLAWYASQNQLNQEWVRFLVEMNHPEEALESAESSRALLMQQRLGREGRPAGRVRDYQAVARSQNAALVSYWLMPDVSYAWVVTPDKVQIRSLPGEYAIASLVARYRSFLEEVDDPLASNNPAGEQLRQAVLDPILPLLAGTRRIILVPDAQLHALNLETLPLHGHYWIEDVTLTLTPSLNMLEAREPSASRSSILAIGDPTPTPEFQKLPNASREIDAVTRGFTNRTILRGAEATPAAYLQTPDAHSYIHFAAHASAVAERPLDSAIVLSSGSLTARDLLRKPIHADLVTLSACRSAGVRSYHGEGLVGLAWVFLQTGAHGVIAGLWDANDDATADLMTDLYTRISKGELPAPALREAKLAMIHSHSHFDRPYYWGPFQYYRGPAASTPSSRVM